MFSGGGSACADDEDNCFFINSGSGMHSVCNNEKLVYVSNLYININVEGTNLFIYLALTPRKISYRDL